MSFLLALFLVVHASIHIGYICGPAWPFVAGDPWVVTLCGANPDAIRTIGITLVLLSFAGYLGASVAAMGFARSLWAPTAVIASVASAMVLILFPTVWTLPGLAIDVELLFATLGWGWRPTPFFGRARHASSARRAAAR